MPLFDIIALANGLADLSRRGFIMTRFEIKMRAKAQLGNSIFGNNWMLALVVCLISSAATALVSQIPAAGAAVSLILTGPLAYGVAKCFLKQTRDGQPMDIVTMFDGFKNYFADTLLIGLMTSIFTALWSLLFIVPGIIKAYSYSMAYYIKNDRPELDWNTCIKESMNLMNGHKADLFVLDLSFIGWYFVGALCLGIGTLWVVPYHRAARAQFYESVSAVTVTPAADTVAE